MSTSRQYACMIPVPRIYGAKWWRSVRGGIFWPKVLNSSTHARMFGACGGITDVLEVPTDEMQISATRNLSHE